MNKGILATLALLAVVIMVVPTILVRMGTASSDGLETKAVAEKKAIKLQVGGNQIIVPVYLTREKRIVKLPLEAYIRGVVAAEMPANFHKEALKAQALAARTYIVERIARNDFSDMVERYGKKAKGAWVSDTVQHQVYLTDDALKKNWGNQYREKSNKINEAVNETRGQVITYRGRPIYAAFFSTSNGKTENSEDYWQAKYPYLRSVASPWDKEAPSYKAGPVTFSVTTLTQKLEQATGKRIAVPASAGHGDWMKVLSRTEGDNIAKVKIGDQTFTGRDVREALNLRSTDFSWHIQGDRIAITTRGYGHGVGMSQWGANLMAKDGKKAGDIVRHYYKGVQVEDYHQWVKSESEKKKS